MLTDAQKIIIGFMTDENYHPAFDKMSEYLTHLRSDDTIATQEINTYAQKRIAEITSGIASLSDQISFCNALITTLNAGVTDV